MGDRYRYTGAEHTTADGTVVRQGEEFEPSERDLKDKEDLWEPVECSTQTAGADIGIRALQMTDAALEVALEAGLAEDDFADVEPKGANGDYLKSQVEALAEEA